MVTTIRIDVTKFNRNIRRFKKRMADTSVPYRESSVAATKYVHGTIRGQGRKRPYAPLAHLTKLKTGKRKALLGLIPLIRPYQGVQSAGVKFLQTSMKWNIRMHHRGYTIPAVSGKFMSFSTVTGSRISFTRRKSTKVPGREIIPTKREIETLVTPIFRKWVNNMAAKWDRG